MAEGLYTFFLSVFLWLASWGGGDGSPQSTETASRANDSVPVESVKGTPAIPTPMLLPGILAFSAKILRQQKTLENHPES